MIDTVRAFAVKWLLEPTKKTPEPPEPSENNIRLVVTIMDASAFAEFAAISAGLQTGYYETTNQYGTNYGKLFEKYTKTFAVKIYDGDEYIGTYAIAKKTNTGYVIDGIEQTDKELEYYYPNPNEQENTIITEEFDAQTQVLLKIDSVCKITKITPLETDIKSVSDPHRSVKVRVEYTEIYDYFQTGYENEHEENERNVSLTISVYMVFSGWQMVYLDGLDYDKMTYYVDKFNRNDNLLEYDFNL